MRFSFGLGIFLSVAAAAFVTHFVSTQKYSGRGGYRHPAAIHPNALDLTDEQVFDSALKRRILSGTRAWREDGNVAITLGHFVARMNGETKELCEIYDDISLTFAAEGLAVSGMRPTITIESPCHPGRDPAYTQVIWIPIDQIKGEKPADLDLRYTTPSDIFVQLKNIPGEWPSYWVLTQLKMLNKKDGRMISIDTATIYKMSQIPVSMTWN